MPQPVNLTDVYPSTASPSQSQQRILQAASNWCREKDICQKLQLTLILLHPIARLTRPQLTDHLRFARRTIGGPLNFLSDRHNGQQARPPLPVVRPRLFARRRPSPDQPRLFRLSNPTERFSQRGKDWTIDEQFSMRSPGDGDSSKHARSGGCWNPKPPSSSGVLVSSVPNAAKGKQKRL